MRENRDQKKLRILKLFTHCINLMVLMVLMVLINLMVLMVLISRTVLI